MRLMPLDDNVFTELVHKGYGDFVLKSRINPGEAAWFQEVPIEVYEAHRASPGPGHMDLMTLKMHIHRHCTDCYVVISD